ncbi:MAG: glycosyltransferase family 39 protein [Eubacterium sp.]|nr:glycosyltransferase family 39 protein [Eubacterium sp.]
MNKTKLDYVYWIFFIMLTLGVIYRIINSVLYLLPEFDGAMNYQVAINLVREGSYSTLYNGGIPFDQKIQSSGPFIFIIALFFKLFGIGSIQALSVNAMFVIFLFVGIFLINKNVNVNKYLCLLEIGIIVITPNFWRFAFGGYGEIPTLTFLTWSIYFLIKAKDNKKFLALSGIFLGLAYLTKTVILIAGPAFLVFFAGKIFWEKMKLREVVKWILSFLFVIGLFELYRFTQLGMNAYIDYWVQNGAAVLSQAGVKGGFADTNNIWDKLVLHLNTYSDLFGLTAIVNIVLLIVLFVVWVYDKIKNKKLSAKDIMILVALFYFGWWLLITPTEKAWARRILIGVVLLEDAIIFYINKLLLYLKEKKQSNILKRGYIIFSGILLLILSYNICLETNKVDKTSISAIKNVANEIRAIKEKDINAVFCGTGWWQSPVIAFLSDEVFYDLDNYRVNGKNIYFVEDHYASGLAGENIKTELSNYNADIVYEDESINTIIYRIDKKKSLFEQMTTVTQTYFKKDDQYDNISGMYDYEVNSNVRWVKPCSAIKLMGTGNHKLYFKFLVKNYTDFEKSNNTMNVYINDELIGQKSINSNGTYEMTMETSVKKGEDVDIVFEFNGVVINTNGDSRQIAFGVEEVGFLE